jgi:hypothetical protein
MELGRELAVFVTFMLYVIVANIIVGLKVVTVQEVIMIIGFMILAEISIGGYYDRREQKEKEA